MNTFVVDGRTFDRACRDGVQEALIDDHLARQFPTGRPLGAKIPFGDETLAVVGVRDDTDVIGPIIRIGLEVAADDRRVPREACAPEAMADDGHGRTARLEVTRLEHAAEGGADAEALEVARGHPGALGRLGERRAAQLEQVEVPGNPDLGR